MMGTVLRTKHETAFCNKIMLDALVMYHLLLKMQILDGKEAHLLATNWVMDESIECLKLTLVTIENLQRLIQKAKQSDSGQEAFETRYQYLYGCCVLVTLRRLLEIALDPGKDNASYYNDISKVLDQSILMEFCEDRSGEFEDEAIPVRAALGVSSLLQFGYLDDPRAWESTSLVNECQSCLTLLAKIKKNGNRSVQDTSRAVQENLLGFIEDVLGFTANSQLFTIMHESLKSAFGLPLNDIGMNRIGLHHLEDISFLAGMTARLTRNQQVLKTPGVLRNQALDTLHLISAALHSLGSKPASRRSQQELMHERLLALSVAAIVEFLASSTPGLSSRNMLEDMLLKSGLFSHMIQAFKSLPRDMDDDLILLGRSLLAVSAYSFSLREWASRVTGYTDAWESLANRKSFQISLLIAIYHTSDGKQGISSVPLDTWMNSTIHSLQISRDKASFLSQLYPALQTLHLVQSCMNSSPDNYQNNTICSIGSLESCLSEIKKLQQDNASQEDNTGIGEIEEILDSDQDEEKTNKLTSSLGTKYRSQHALVAQCHVLLKSLLAESQSNHKVD